MDNQHLTYESIPDVDIKEELVESDDETPWNIDTECSVEESAIKRQRLNSSNEEESCMDEEELQSPETIFVQMGYETEESNSEEEMDPLAQDDENLIGDVAEEKKTKKGNSSYGGCHVEADEVIAMYMLWQIFKKRQKIKKREWVQPAMSERYKCGIFHLHFKDLVNNSEKFFNYFRMNLTTFNELYGLLEESLRFQNTNMRCAISAKERLVVTLRYLASGCKLTELHNSFRIGISTLRSIIKDTCKKIWNILQPTMLPVPTVEKWKEIAELFWKRGNFPNCIGAIDGRCFQTVSPNSCTSRRKKTWTSLVLLAVCDTDYCFTLVDIGKKNSDVFEESSISNLISSNSLNLPPPCPLPNTSSPNLPFLMVGDEAFPLSRNVMRPYGGKNLKGEKSVFNYRLTRAQRFIECSFGIFSNKWHIVQRPFNVHEDFATDIIKACVILHNFVITRDGFLFEDTLTQVGLIDFVGNGNQRSRNAAKIRDHLAKYFVGTGSVPWQMS
ncbi:hypothetical protein R5R35_003009 [Gryllus longicercus]|uniref:DDE Tnp4 domain-containing protein n=1 Tax=Gryllus longicercus TaxID=2509291 RepID=A0AAN9YXW7_9ORTH